MRAQDYTSEEYQDAVAVVGMAGRYKDAPDLSRFWSNLASGYEAVTFLGEEELRHYGCPAGLSGHPEFIPASAMMHGIDAFDADFFGYTAAEARMMDPQLRLMLQTSWLAFEHANILPGDTYTLTGVFAGAQRTDYPLYHFDADYTMQVGMKAVGASILNGQDFLSTWISYKLGLTGPSLNIQTACSTGLVTVATACQNLVDYNCDVALAIAGAIFFPRHWGYIAEEGSILSKDGHCRPFDARASGTVTGEGTGAVVLKRLSDALRDKNTIRGVIRGFAINNDGPARAGYAAPSGKGQKAVIEQALASAMLDSSDISYIESHGTGTALGDPIEFGALQSIFGPKERRSPCFLGSLKANLGHLGACAGMASLHKTLLMFAHDALVPQINFSEPLPELDFERSAFRIATQPTAWPELLPRRAGISSFGFGGTNCHMIVEGPLPVGGPDEIEGAPGFAVGALPLCLSAKSEQSLKDLCVAWVEFLAGANTEEYSRFALTAIAGRTAMPWRVALPGLCPRSAAEALRNAGAIHAGPVRPHRCALLVNDLDGLSRLGDWLSAPSSATASIYRQHAADVPQQGGNTARAHEGEASHVAGAVIAVKTLLTLFEQLRIPMGPVLGTAAARPVVNFLNKGIEASGIFSPAPLGEIDQSDRAGSEANRIDAAMPGSIVRACAAENVTAIISLVPFESPSENPFENKDARAILDPLPVIPLFSEADGPGKAEAGPAFEALLSSFLSRLFVSGIPFTIRAPGSLADIPAYCFAQTSYWPALNHKAVLAPHAVQGKVLEPDPAANEQRKDGQDPVNFVLGVWSSALGREDIGKDDDFFQLGGTSLSAITILGEVKKNTGLSLSMGEFLELRTPINMLKRLEALAENA